MCYWRRSCPEIRRNGLSACMSTTHCWRIWWSRNWQRRRRRQRGRSMRMRRRDCAWTVSGLVIVVGLALYTNLFSVFGRLFADIMLVDCSEMIVIINLINIVQFDAKGILTVLYIGVYKCVLLMCAWTNLNIHIIHTHIQIYIFVHTTMHILMHRHFSKHSNTHISVTLGGCGTRWQISMVLHPKWSKMKLLCMSWPCQERVHQFITLCKTQNVLTELMCALKPPSYCKQSVRLL